ncbi:hypothetical protein C5D50_04510 [Rathayibacter sp. RFBD1]|nr:hypothetical protein C5D50_04510 [Rathayibacter sp. RFBD1]PPI60803.1 hypothetical protein C5D38_04245 [Rathayibacter sp. TRS19]
MSRGPCPEDRSEDTKEHDGRALAADEWPPVLRAFVLTAVVVPLAVYQVVPRLLLLHGRIVAFRGRHRAARG